MTIDVVWTVPPDLPFGIIGSSTERAPRTTLACARSTRQIGTSALGGGPPGLVWTVEVRCAESVVVYERLVEPALALEAWRWSRASGGLVQNDDDGDERSELLGP